MMNEDINFLKTKVDKGTVKLSFTDGEEVIAKILSVSETEKDVIFDIISNSQNKPIDTTKAYRATFDEIKAVSEAA